MLPQFSARRGGGGGGGGCGLDVFLARSDRVVESFLGREGKRRETERREGEMAARVGGRLLFLKQQQQYGKLLYNNNKSFSSPLVGSVAAPLLHSVLESQEESIPAGLLRAASQLSQGRYHQFLLFQVYEEDEEVWAFFSFFLFFRVFDFLRFTKSLRPCTTN